MSDLARTAILLTTFNRPHLVVEAIRSVLAQRDDRWRLIVLDDGCNDATRAAIHDGLTRGTRERRDAWRYDRHVAGGTVVQPLGPVVERAIVWWQGPPRSMAARRETIPYSWTINIALNHLLTDETYITYLCDDDVLTPNSIGDRAAALDAMPDVAVVYGRLRAVQYPKDATAAVLNTWADAGPARPVTADFPIPTGQRVLRPGHGSLMEYRDGLLDPDTQQPFVEEGFWMPGPMTYGLHGCTDHNQVMHRRRILTDGYSAFGTLEQGREFWPEDPVHAVGDAGFFRRIAHHPFWGIDSWVVTKRYHAKSWGTPDDDNRE